MMQPWPAGTECPHVMYSEFKDLLNQASYHFAADSGSEWAAGYQYVESAAKLVINYKVPFWAIKRMVADAKSMVDLHTLMQKVLTLLYNA
jgi:hypothetical protein